MVPFSYLDEASISSYWWSAGNKGIESLSNPAVYDTKYQQVVIFLPSNEVRLQENSGALLSSDVASLRLTLSASKVRSFRVYWVKVDSHDDV